MISKYIPSIFLMFILIFSFSGNSVILQKSAKQNDSIITLINYIYPNLGLIAFAESGNDVNATVDENATTTVQSEDQNKTEDEHKSEKEHQGEEEHKVEIKVEIEKGIAKIKAEFSDQKLEFRFNSTDKDDIINEIVSKTGLTRDQVEAAIQIEGENQPEANQEGIDEINNENNNEQATHEENEQIANGIENAKNDKTVAAEVDIGAGNEETKSINSNINIHTNSTSDAVSVTVDSKTESGPKVIIFNLNSTTIDVANIKYLHVTYDGHSIAPAADVNAVLHPKSTDEPSYAIIVTQNGAQILVSIPHFSAHTITLSKISKVIPPIPEFPIAWLTLLAALIPIVALSRKVSIWDKD